MAHTNLSNMKKNASVRLSPQKLSGSKKRLSLVVHGYKMLFLSILKLLALATLCVVLSFAVVFPLWKWALSSPKSYTYCMLALLALTVISFLARRIKKHGIRPFLRGLLRVLVIAGGIALSVFCVLSGLRFAALLVLAAMFIASGILASGANKKER